MPVKLREPRNPVDARVILIMCFLAKLWERIGHIVKEALDDVHKTIDE